MVWLGLGSYTPVDKRDKRCVMRVCVCEYTCVLLCMHAFNKNVQASIYDTECLCLQAGGPAGRGQVGGVTRHV